MSQSKNNMTNHNIDGVTGINGLFQVIKLWNLPLTAGAKEIRTSFFGLSVTKMLIIGGLDGEAFVTFSTDEDARRAMLLNGCYINGAKIELSVSSVVERAKAVINVVRCLLPKPKQKMTEWVSVLPYYRFSDENPRKIIYRRRRLESDNRHQQAQSRFASDGGGAVHNNDVLSNILLPHTLKSLVVNSKDVFYDGFSQKICSPLSICGNSIVSDRPLLYGNNSVACGCGIPYPYSMDVFCGKTGRPEPRSYASRSLNY